QNLFFEILFEQQGKANHLTAIFHRCSHCYRRWVAFFIGSVNILFIYNNRWVFCFLPTHSKEYKRCYNSGGSANGQPFPLAGCFAGYCTRQYVPLSRYSTVKISYVP